MRNELKAAKNEWTKKEFRERAENLIAERGKITTSVLLRKVGSEGAFDERDLVTILLSLAKCRIIESQRKHTRHLTLSSSRRSFN